MVGLTSPDARLRKLRPHFRAQRVGRAEGLENRLGQAHIPVMEAFIKIGLLATLVVLTLGVLPDRRKGAVIAIGTCVAMALVLHFVAP